MLAAAATRHGERPSNTCSLLSAVTRQPSHPSAIPPTWHCRVLHIRELAGWHMSCLTPPLTNVPEGKWFCPPCVGLKTHPVAWADELVGKKIEVEWRVIRPADGSGAGYGSPEAKLK